ncbi:MAG: hypothetical protein HY608_07530 [Planctomycetes bacterium]|nr:hypothetical protein [Planctomycetota bacterium]
MSVKGREGSRGAVFVLALGTMVILFSICVTFLQNARRHVKIVDNEWRGAMALYCAEAGAEDAIRELIGNASWRTGFSGKSFATADGVTGTYTTSLADVSGNVEIASTGTWGNASRTVVVTVGVGGGVTRVSWR